MGRGGGSYSQVFVDILQNSLVLGNYFKIMSSTKTCICKMSKHERLFLVQDALVCIN